MRLQVTLAFTRLPDADLLTKANQVMANMTNNPNFPTPSPALTEVQPLLTAFQTALAAAGDGGKVKTAAKNDAREALVEPLRNLAIYVQQNCGNDLTKLLSSGFEARKTPQPAGILPAPLMVTLTNTGISGEIAFRSPPVDNASAYEAQSTSDPASIADWENQGTFSAARATLPGFAPGKVVWIRERAIGAAGPGIWSEPASIMVS